MLVDGRSVESDDVLSADICIVGAGPAGISAALELSGRGLKVLLLESGGLVPEPGPQALAEGDSVGETYPPLHRARVRAFGGSSRHWPGHEAMMARPLEPIDFERREGVPHSGWPFDRAHLEPYYRRAHDICELRSHAYDLDSWAGEEAASRLALAEDVVATTVIQSAPPDAFVRGGERLHRSADVTVLLHATVIGIRTGQAPDEVSGLQVASAPGRTFAVTARRYVLAAGGIDNARLLLLGDPDRPHGLADRHDVVGRFFMEHLWMRTGLLLPSDPSSLTRTGPYQLRHSGTDRWRGVIGLTPQVLRREQLPNGVFFLDVADRFHSSPAASSLAALRRLARQRPAQPDLLRHALTVLRHGGDLAAAAGQRARRGHSPPRAFVLQSMSEQSPNPSSRVTLSRRRDGLGVPRASLEWRRTAADVDSVRRAQQLIADEVAVAGVGRLIDTLDEPAPVVYGTWHHMGTTRMHTDARVGVTDADGRVHGMRNLYVTGSSVFPTGGYVNPTLTIVALAIRLADHLRDDLLAPPHVVPTGEGPAA